MRADPPSLPRGGPDRGRGLRIPRSPCRLATTARSGRNLAAAVLAAGFGATVLFSAQDVAPPAAPPASPDLVASVTAAPALVAVRTRAEAARARLDAAGRFPDPEIEGMISRKGTPDEVMPMYELNLRQPLPRSGERAADQDRAAAVLAMAEAEFALMAGEMATDVAMALAEAGTASRRIDALTTQIERVGQVLAAVDARIATGQARLADRLALQSRITSMQLMVEQDRRMADDAFSEARSLLGLRADAPLPAPATLPPAMIDPEHTPALIVASARRSEAEAMGRMARASARPMTAVGLRLEREEERMGNNDTVGLAFMTELPWRSRRYARAEERAAQAEASAASSDAAAARHRITAAVSRVERAERLAETSRRLGQETRARLGADLESLINSAGAAGMAGESTVLMILEILEKTTDAQLQVIDAEGAELTARAGLWRYAPARYFSNTTASSP